MAADKRELAWNLFTELRKELVELQKIRSQVIGFKITFVSAAIALIGANLNKLPSLLFVVPGFAAIFFDLLVHSYSFSIKRTGFYCREYLEPILKSSYALSDDELLWQQFMASPNAGRNVSFWGNLGITLLALGPALYGLFQPFHWLLSTVLILLLLGLLAYDIASLYKPLSFELPSSPKYKNPKPCVAIIIEKDGKVLLAERGIDPGKGCLDIPGGFIDIAESAETAVIREASEETTMQVKVVEYLGSLPDVYGDSSIETLNFAYVVNVVSGEPQARSDVKRLIWHDYEHLPSAMAFNHQRQVLEWARKRHIAMKAADQG